MNKNIHRIIFNAARGIRMAVSEVATSQGKAASGQSAAPSTVVGPVLWAATVGASVVAFSLLLSAPLNAQVIADKAAPKTQQPTVLQSASGTTQVNIQTPSSAGVSRNTYSQFDVNKGGVILNNSRTDTPTQLGGYVQGNPWLATGGARVILNEVNSSSPSQLKGFVEVAGQRAEVIIANPAGISVDGAGFINASGVTLTTGSPVVNAGSLESFRVRGGTVTVDGAGLDTSTADYTNILARAVQVNAGIWAKDLKVVAGLNDISASSAANPAVTATVTGTGAAPAYALDVSALGGMYAGKIYLIGTEAGVGVRNSGVIGATAGDVTLSNSGWLSNSGSIYAAGNTAITTQGSIANTGAGLIAAQGNTTLNAQGANAQITSDKAATLAAGMDGAGAVGSTGTLNIAATSSATLSGKVAAGAAANLTAYTLVTDGATVSAEQLNIAAHDLSNVGGKLQQSGTGDMTIILPGTLNNTGGTIAANAQNLTLGAANIDNKAGTISHAGTGTLAVNAGAFNGSAGNVTSNGQLSLNASGAVDLQNATTSAQQVSISAATLSNKGGRVVQSSTTQPAANIAVANTLDNTGGLIGSNSGMQISAGSVSNATGQIVALQTLDLTSGGTVSNNAGLIQSNGALRVQSASLDNTGATLSSAKSSVAISTAGQTNNTSGKITAASDINLNSGSIQNAKGQIVGAGNIGIAATLLDNTQGLVQSDATLSVRASQIINAATFTAPSSTATALGLVGKDVQLVADSLNNQGGEVLAGKTLTVQTSQSIDNGAGSSSAQTGLLYAGTSNTIQTAGITGNGQVLSQGDLRVDVRGDFNNSGSLNANGNASVTSSGTINNSGTLSAGQTLSVAAANLNNTAAGVLSGTTGTNVTLADTLTNRGLIDSGNSAGTSLTRIQAQTVNNIGTGSIYGDNVAVAANTLTNDAETLAAVSKAGVIASRKRLDLGLTTLNNNNGATILSLGDMAIGGALDANNKAMGAANGVTNSSSQIQSVNGNVVINTATLQNLNPTFRYEVVDGTPSAQKTQYTNTQGQSYMAEEVAMLIHQPGQSSDGDYFGRPAPANRILLANSPLATGANIAAYHTPAIYTEASSSCYNTGDGTESCSSIPATFTPPTDASVWATVGMTAPTLPPPTTARPASGNVCVSGCNGDNQSPTYEYVDNSAAEAQWDKAAQPYITLQTKLDTLRSNMNAAMQYVQKYSTYTETTQKAVVNGGTPATISSGANITINASNSALNDNSRVLAGGALILNVPGGALSNNSKSVTVNSVQLGSSMNWISWVSPGSTDWYSNYSGRGLNQNVPTTVQVSNDQALQYTTRVKPSAQAEAAAGGGGLSGSSAANPAGTQALNTAAAQSANAANRIASTTASVKLPTSSLYQINSNPSATYLVQTDPRFTNRNNWLSSDYISTRNALDPNVTQKRLGDGFYEQQLIREQVAALTGQRFLGNYQNDEQQYMALMNSGLSFASKYNLREGIALSPEQMAMLTTDIVWLEQQTITLADGSTTQALVPHVYAALKDGDLAASGALLGGNTVSINTAGDLTNSGTIAGRKTVNIAANNIYNLLGQINGGDTTLKAKQDINNIGGSISADNNLKLEAGRDINITSTTQKSEGSTGSAGSTYQYSQSGIDRMAGLYTRGPGTLLASAGNNINLTAAQVSSGGDAQIEAGNNLNLVTLQKTQSDQIDETRVGDIHLRTSTSQDIGSSIKSAGNTSLKAGNTLQATAATVEAGGDLGVNANNIVLLAGQTTSTLSNTSTASSSGVISSSSTSLDVSASSATAQVNQLSGKNVSITAEQDLVSVGSKFKAQDTLSAEGKNSQTFYAAKDVTQSSTTVETSSSVVGISMGNKATTDTSTKAVSVASTLESTNAINIRVGNSATFEGADINAKTTTFTKTDPNKAGQLNLYGSVDTSETVHTEKSDTMGVYQSQSGSGSTIQSLNLTKINGAVNIDQNLAVAVQLPKTVTTSGEKANTAAAANATNATSQASVQAQIDELSKQPGLSYLSQLSSNASKTNPAQWSQVQLAHDNWNYSQSGLTPAGAALLSIAVAAYTGGMGAEMLGGTAGTAATATTAATSATLMGSTVLGAAANAGFASLAAQASVAMVNNGGDIGKTLSQLGSDQSIKNLLTTMVTAGALDSLNSSMSIDGTKLSNINAQNAGLGANLAKNVINNLANATITSTLTGANLEDSLKTGLVSAMISAGAGQTANTIGDLTVNDQVTKALAHALAGCVAGAAGAGSQGCSSGAIGAVVGELAAQWYDNPPGSKSPADVLNFAKVMSAAAGAITGDGSAQSVNTAVMTGTNAVQNNYLAHSEATARAALKDKQAKGTLTTAEQQQLTNLEVLDIARDLALKDACQSQGDACNAARRDLNAAIGSYAAAGGAYNPKLSAAGNKSVTAELKQDVALSNDSSLAQQTLWDSFKEFAVPQVAGYATGAALSAYVAEAQVLYAAVKAETNAVSAGAAADLVALAKAKVNNNFYSDGSIADPSKPMSASGPWKSVAELTPQEANALISSRLPAGVKVTGISSADAANASSVGAGYQAPYVPGTNLVEIVTTQPTKFVRLYGGDSNQAGGWVMRAEDIAGLTPQQIASKYSLPQVPTMMTDVTIPAGTKLNVSAANNISPGATKGNFTGDNIGGGGVQFQIQTNGRVPTDWFTNGRPMK